MSPPIGLQLYSVRHALDDAFEPTLQQVAQIGYTQVELAGLHGRTAEQFRRACEGVGLAVVASHVALASMLEQFDRVVDEAQVLGCGWVVVPSAPNRFRAGKRYTELAKVLNDLGGRLGVHGLGLCYHNHSFEFDPDYKGRRGMDVLWERARGYAAELDVAWVHHGGDAPAEWLQRLSGRVPLLHVKDLAEMTSPTFVELGQGLVDLPAVLAAAEGAGVEHVLVEQDAHWVDADPIASARVSHEALAAMLTER